MADVDEAVIQQSELRNNNADVMRRVAAGESFVITVHGRPVADLVPHQRERVGRGVTVGELRAALRSLGLPPDDGWGRDLEEAGQALDDRITDPWEWRRP